MERHSGPGASAGASRPACQPKAESLTPIFVVLLFLIFGALRARADTPFTATYNLSDTLTVIGPGAGAGQLTYGVSAQVVDHQFDGKTILINTISITANGNAIGTRVNFDWNVWFNNAPLGLTPGGAQTTPNSGTVVANTTPASYSTGWHFIVGNTVLPAPGAFPLSASRNFLTGQSAASPHKGATTVATSNPAQVANGLDLQVAAWSGDNDPTTTVNFTMSGIQVVVTGVIGEAGSPRIKEFPLPTPAGIPSGMVLGPDGNVWFADEGASAIAKVTPAGVITEFPTPTPNSLPFVITVGPDGNLWFTELGATDPSTFNETGAIGRITPAGVITEFPLSTVDDIPFGIAAGPDGNLWFTAGSLASLPGAFYVAKISTAGVITPVTTPSTSGNYRDIVLGSDGNFWIEDAHSPTGDIVKLTPSGVMTQYSLPTAGANPNQLTLGPDGNVWFGEPYGVDQIAFITPSGQITEFPVPGVDIHGLAAGQDGNIWAADLSGNKIVVISTTGQLLEEFAIGTIGSQPDTMTRGANNTIWFGEFTGNKIGEISTCPLPDAPVDLKIAPAGNSDGPVTGTDFLALSWQAAAPPTVTEFTVPTAGSGPNVITSGPDGNLWFTERTANQIGKLTLSGSFTEFPIATPNYGPEFITAGPDGNLWFTGDGGGGGGVGRITPSGTITQFPTPPTTFPTEPSITNGIAAGPDGNLWFSTYDGDTQNNLARITPTGTVTNFILSSAGADIEALTFGPDGALWCAEDQEAGPAAIDRITTSGTETIFPIPSPNGYRGGITAGPDGALWFTEVGINGAGPNKVGRITTSGVVTEFSIPTPDSGPLGIAAGPDGNLWFAESSANQIGRLTPSGIFTEYSLPTLGSGPNGVTSGPDGAIWFTEFTGNKIGRITVGGGTGSPPIRYEYRINGSTYTSTTDTTGQAPPTGTNDPITLFVRAYACDPEIGPGPEASTTVSVAPPQASFSVSPASPGVNQAAILTDTSTPQATSWLWLYDDGTPASTAESQTHAFTTTGAHLVGLLSTNGSGTNFIEKTITVGTSPEIVPTISSIARISYPGTLVDPLPGNQFPRGGTYTAVIQGAGLSGVTGFSASNPSVTGTVSSATASEVTIQLSSVKVSENDTQNAPIPSVSFALQAPAGPIASGSVTLEIVAGPSPKVTNFQVTNGVATIPRGTPTLIAFSATIDTAGNGAFPYVGGCGGGSCSTTFTGDTGTPFEHVLTFTELVTIPLGSTEPTLSIICGEVDGAGQGGVTGTDPDSPVSLTIPISSAFSLKTTHSRVGSLTTISAYPVKRFSTNGPGTSFLKRTGTIAFESIEPGRKRLNAITLSGEGQYFLHLGRSWQRDQTVYLRFLDGSGAVSAERRLSCQRAQEAVFDIGAYGLRGQYALELVSGKEIDAWITRQTEDAGFRGKGDRHE